MTDAPSSSSHPLLKDFQLHGWIPDPTLSDDENIIDLVMLVTRNSKCRQGGMACVLIANDSATAEAAAPLLQRLVAVCNNTSVYKDRDSDVHAEMNALAYAAKCGQHAGTDGSTAYITMPPCKRCFGVLLAAGIGRIVTTRDSQEPIVSIAKERNVELVVMDATAATERINKYIPKLDASAIDAERAARKKEKQEQKLVARERKRKAPDSIDNT
jgi:deoxycytidylate deaminase